MFFDSDIDGKSNYFVVLGCFEY